MVKNFGKAFAGKGEKIIKGVEVVSAAENPDFESQKSLDLHPASLQIHTGKLNNI